MMSWLQNHADVLLGTDRRNHWRDGGRNTTTRGSILTRPAGRPSYLGHRKEERQLGLLLLSSGDMHRAHAAKA